MFESHIGKVKDRIVSIQQAHVRPIVRGRLNLKPIMVDGFSFLDTVSWAAFSEGSYLSD
jgi:hypothetical protein